MQSRMPDAAMIPREAVIGARRGSGESHTSRLPLRATTRAAIPCALAGLLEAIALATPAAAQGMIATGSGRAGAQVAALASLIAVVFGGRALRSSRAPAPAGARNGRDGAIVAVVLGAVGVVLATLHLATTSGGFGTGNGRAGAIVAALLGLVAVVIGRMALARSSALNARREARSDA